MPGVEFAWPSSDTLVAVVDDAGHVTSIGPGKTAVRAVAAEVTGQVELTVVAPKGVVLTGTVWVSPDVITDADPSALDSVVYVGRGMRGFYDPFECERRWRDDLVVFLFEAHFAGGATMEVQAHTAYGEAESALAAARQFLPPMGRLPRMLIDGGREVELSPAPDYGAGTPVVDLAAAVARRREGRERKFEREMNLESPIEMCGVRQRRDNLTGTDRRVHFGHTVQASRNWV